MQLSVQSLLVVESETRDIRNKWYRQLLEEAVTQAEREAILAKQAEEEVIAPQ